MVQNRNRENEIKIENFLVIIPGISKRYVSSFLITNSLNVGVNDIINFLLQTPWILGIMIWC